MMRRPASTSKRCLESEDIEEERSKRQNSEDESRYRTTSLESTYTTDEYISEDEETCPRPFPKSVTAPRRWNSIEDRRLRLAVQRHGEANWKAIAAEVGSRNHVQCLQRWKKVLCPGLVKGQWSPEEDETLKKLAVAGYKNWGQLALHMPGRTSKQCRERWCHHLDPSINRNDYEEHEDLIIIAAQKKLGNKWSQIAAQLPGRTENAIKIRWKVLQRRMIAKGSAHPEASASSTSTRWQQEEGQGNTSNTSAAAAHMPLVVPPLPPAAETILEEPRSVQRGDNTSISEPFTAFEATGKAVSSGSDNMAVPPVSLPTHAWMPSGEVTVPGQMGRPSMLECVAEQLAQHCTWPKPENTLPPPCPVVYYSTQPMQYVSSLAHPPSNNFKSELSYPGLFQGNAAGLMVASSPQPNPLQVAPVASVPRPPRLPEEMNLPETWNAPAPLLGSMPDLAGLEDDGEEAASVLAMSNLDLVSEEAATPATGVESSGENSEAPLRSCCSFLNLAGDGLVVGEMPLSW